MPRGHSSCTRRMTAIDLHCCRRQQLMLAIGNVHRHQCCLKPATTQQAHFKLGYVHRATAGKSDFKTCARQAAFAALRDTKEVRINELNREHTQTVNSLTMSQVQALEAGSCGQGTPE